MAGFTLVELMVVLVIGAILLAIAVPTYQSQVRQSRRTDAKTAVLDLAAREEKYLSLNNAYTNSAINLGYSATTATWPQTVGSGYYQIYVCVSTVAAGNTGTMSSSGVFCPGGTATTGVPAYVVSAIAVTGKSQASDSSCQYFAVDNTGAQDSGNSQSGLGTATTTTCWQ